MARGVGADPGGMTVRDARDLGLYLRECDLRGKPLRPAPRAVSVDEALGELVGEED